MHRRLALLAALALAALAAAGPASAAVTQGGPWAPDVMSVVTLDDTTWLATTDRGMFRTDDAGLSWKAVTSFPAAEGADPAPSDFEPAVVAAMGTGVVAIDANRTVGVSRDLGQHWTFHEHRGAWWGLIRLAIDPGNNEHLLLTTNDSGLQVSTDGGVTWSQGALTGAGTDTLDNMQILSNGDVIALDPTRHDNGYLVSEDGGLTWPLTRTVGGLSRLVGIVESAPGHLVAIGTDGATCSPFEPQDSASLSVLRDELLVRISTNGGVSWTDGGTTCTQGSVTGGGGWHGLVGSGDTVAFVSGSPMVSVSTDGGATFVDPAPEKPGFLQMLSGFAAAGSGDLVVSGNTGVFLVSADDVVSRSAGIASYSGLGGLAIAPGDTSTILASLGERGVFRSADGGATWAATAGQVAPQVHLTSVVQAPVFADGTHAAFAIDAPGTAPHTDGLRVFVTDDAGESWALAQVVDGYEPGGPIDFAAGDVSYLPMNLPYVDVAADPSRCAVGVSDTSFSTFAARPIRVGGVDANCTRLTAIASDPADAQTLVAAGQYIDGDSGEVLARRYYRSTDGGTTWTVPTGLGGVFPTRDWAPAMHISYAGSRVFIWQSRSSTLCTSTDHGASFDCKQGSFATTPGGPGWFEDGYLSSFEPQADGSIIASVVDPADWTSRNDALPDAGVATYLARSVDGGATWAVADPTESAAITDVVDVAAQASARSSARRAAGTRRLVLGSAGVYRRRVAFKRAARGRANPSLAGIVVRRSGTATVTVTCPRGKRCTGYVRLTSRGRFTSALTAFDVSRATTRIVVRLPKAKAKRLAAGDTIAVRVAIDRTVGGADSYATSATVRR